MGIKVWLGVIIIKVILVHDISIGKASIKKGFYEELLVFGSKPLKCFE